MELRQLFDKESSTYTYLIAEGKSRKALIIDPVIEQLDRDVNLIRELGLTLCYALDTHVHADHVSGLGALRDRTGCQTGLSAASGADCSDLKLRHSDRLFLGELAVEIYETPGHTRGCLTYHVAGNLFTGDALLVRGCGRTDFQGGDAGTLYDSVTQTLFKFPDPTKVYPGHDYKGHTVSTIGEEKRLNPRLTKSRPEFIEFMKTLNLPEPKLIHVAVPINLRCGKA